MFTMLTPIYATLFASVSMSDVVTGWKAIVPSIPSVHNFTVKWTIEPGDLRTNSIGDGGDDMYDTGNKLSVRAIGEAEAYEIDYAHDCTSSTPMSPTGSGDITFKTCALPNAIISVFTSANSTIDKFRISGGTGADGDGFTFWNTAPLTLTTTSGDLIHGWYKSVSEVTFLDRDADQGALADASCPDYYDWDTECVTRGDRNYCAGRDPTVNHLIITQPGAIHTASCDTDDDTDVLEWTGTGVSWLVQITWGGAVTDRFDEFGSNATLHSVADYTKVFAAIVEASIGSIKLPAAPTASTSSAVDGGSDSGDGGNKDSGAGCAQATKLQENSVNTTIVISILGSTCFLLLVVVVVGAIYYLKVIKIKLRNEEATNYPTKFRSIVIK